MTKFVVSSFLFPSRIWSSRTDILCISSAFFSLSLCNSSNNAVGFNKVARDWVSTIWEPINGHVLSQNTHTHVKLLENPWVRSHFIGDILFYVSSELKGKHKEQVSQTTVIGSYSDCEEKVSRETEKKKKKRPFMSDINAKEKSLGNWGQTFVDSVSGFCFFKEKEWKKSRRGSEQSKACTPTCVSFALFPLSLQCGAYISCLLRSKFLKQIASSVLVCPLINSILLKNSSFLAGDAIYSNFNFLPRCVFLLKNRWNVSIKKFYWQEILEFETFHWFFFIFVFLFYI